MNAVKVLMTENQYNYANRIIGEYAKDGIENGYSLLGIIHKNKVYEIKKIIPAGPNSDRGGAHFTVDETIVRDELEKELQELPDIRYLGDNHSHPWRTEPRPSGIDVNQLVEAREQRPWTIIGVHSLTTLKFFGLDYQNNPIEIPYQIVPDSFSEDLRVSRIEELTQNETLEGQNVAVLGCGSLSCSVIQSLAATGLRSFLLADMDEFSDVNVIRHIGDFYDLKKDKVDILKSYIECHNPLADVRPVKDDLLKNRNLLSAIVEWADIIIAASGNPALNYQINIQCVKKNKPVVFGGIYDRAESAYAFFYDPSEKKACFECIMGLTSAAVDNNTIKRKYGLDDGELKEAQGLFTDILPVGCMMAKMALWLMMKQKQEFNLVRYYNNLKTERFNVTQKKGCATCDYTDWLRHQEENLEEKETMFLDRFWEYSKRFWRKLSFGF